MGSCLSSRSGTTSSLQPERLDQWDELEEKPAAGQLAADVEGSKSAGKPARSHAQQAAGGAAAARTGNKYSTAASSEPEQEDAAPGEVTDAAEEVTPAANVTVTSLLDKYKQHEYRQPRKPTILTTASPDVILSRPPVAVHTDEEDSEKPEDAEEEEEKQANWQYQPSPVRAVEQRHDIAAMSQAMVLPGAIGLDDEFE